MLLWVSTRLMGYVQNVRLKHPVIYLLAGLMLSAGVFTGFAVGGTAWTLIPAAVIAAAAIIEIRHVAFRRRHRIPPLPSAHTLGRIRRPVGSVQPAVLRHQIELPPWRGRPFTVLHLSDLHIDRWFPAEWFADSVRRLAAMKPDLVFLTGDAVNRKSDLARAEEVLKPLAAIAPSYAVLGNHDFWLDAGLVTGCLGRAGFTVLRNEARRVDVAGGAILLSGCDEPWDDIPWRAPDPRGLPLFVLVHTADGFAKYSAAGANAVFAGHYHAGQVRVPAIGPLLMPSVNGRRFDHGHFVLGGAHLLISAGLGTEYPPPRIFCRPDVFEVEIRPAPALAAQRGSPQGELP
jgi:predicted MPP superfamily phosphohydrolase